MLLVAWSCLEPPLFPIWHSTCDNCIAIGVTKGDNDERRTTMAWTRKNVSATAKNAVTSFRNRSSKHNMASKGMRNSRQLQSQAIRITTFTSWQMVSVLKACHHDHTATDWKWSKHQHEGWRRQEKSWYFNKLVCIADKLIFRIKNRMEYIVFLYFMLMSDVMSSDINENSSINPHSVSQISFSQLLDISLLVYEGIQNQVPANSDGQCTGTRCTRARERRLLLLLHLQKSIHMLCTTFGLVELENEKNVPFPNRFILFCPLQVSLSLSPTKVANRYFNRSKMERKIELFIYISTLTRSEVTKNIEYIFQIEFAFDESARWTTMNDAADCRERCNGKIEYNE